MADLPVIQLPLPEEEQPKTLYARITNVNEPPKFDDIRNSNLSREEKVRQIQYRTKAYQDDVDRELHKNYARIGLGGLVSAVGALPIAITKNPVIGSAIGGGVYELGQGIMEGDELPELMQRSGFGAAIGGAAGGVVSKAPQATKFVNDLSGGKIENALKPIGNKITNSKLYDALMTDIRAFDPNKQTVYHGSPYDFNKFSNEAIGTGEGAQAHGYGHYAALDKNVADKNYRQALTGDDFNNMKYFYKNAEVTNRKEKAIIASILENGKENVIKVREKNLPRYKYDEKEYNQKLKELDFVKNINENLIRKDTDKGQLYKLSIPKDDVMLREGATFAQQPKKVQKAIEKELKEQLGTFNYSDEELESLKNLIIHQNPEKLSKYGVKGISYNGGIDGEARVIFNPDDIVIGRKYYNQPNLYQQLTGKQNTGALVDALFNR